MMADAFSPPVVIVGAGLAGLFCAVHLHASIEGQTTISSGGTPHSRPSTPPVGHRSDLRSGPARPSGP